ncbi:MAG: hypothetical protein HC857_13740 [Synechococcales cyanobacterium RU_4_20]|nr:hypothetical protein [Synechococcales cyanobacterium RU_4_20]NJR70487.1 hypothetical protein [Synechococcales cyanobacterium CRU_2_2]
MTNAELQERLNRRLSEFSPSLLRIVFEFVEFLAQRQQKLAPMVEPSAAGAEEGDPLIGLFSGSATLAADAEEILQQGIKSESGWTWKQQ